MDINKKIMRIIQALEGFEQYSDEQLLLLNFVDEQLFDSITFVILIVELEKEFDICINNENMLVERFSTINDISNLILHCLNESIS